MNENTKVIVFEKKEVGLIFMCVLAISFISFSLGIRIGKNFKLTQAGITEADRREVELKSADEELVEKVIHEQAQEGHAPAKAQEKDAKSSKYEQRQSTASSGSTQDMHYKKLEDEFNHIDQEINPAVTTTPPLVLHPRGAAGRHTDEEEGPAAAEEKTKKMESRAEKVEGSARPPVEAKAERAARSEERGEKVDAEKAGTDEKNYVEQKKEAYAGKYTIQLGSYQAESDAVKFADGFKVRGYSPIIQQVKLEGKGDWYRVSLGAFANVGEAKEYILKEESLFQGQDYVITEFQ